LKRHPMAVVAWTHSPARQHELALDLKGLLLIPPRGGQYLPRVLRYVWAAGWTAGALIRSRPSAVLVTCPPIPAGVVVWIMSRILHFPFALDSHPGAFGLMGDRLSARLRPFHEFLIRRARYVAVTTPSLVAHVAGLGGKGGILHESPRCGPNSLSRSGDYVIFPSSGGRDEPYGLMARVALLAPTQTFVMTGDLKNSDMQTLIAGIGNISQTGWLGSTDFMTVVAGSKAVVVLSTEPDSVMRTAYEAVFLRKPLIVTRSLATEQFFPSAAHVENDPDSVMAGVRRAMATSTLQLSQSRSDAIETWQVQLSDLRHALGGDGDSGRV
jgi:hypothetical protein